ncbi:hypothetical protein Q8G38_03565 [Halomonas venusta]|uniref:hypothetical protein n=1 Tax=Vreelandella venusta TaxID=44935 RepID=UPI00295EFD1E|nr:hypothetical protein [Halomonas venusta]MDW0358387.1 hypothetical protein [Halomonas venusta]
MIEIDLLTILTLSGIWISMTFAALVYYKSSRQRMYDEKNNKANLEMLRESYEKKMYEMMDRLVRTEERWKDMNHLVLSAQKRELSPYEKHDGTLTEFLKAHGLNSNDIKVDNDSVFVLTPFHPKYQESFKVISEVCRDVGLRCYRGDEEHISGDLLPHTLKQLCKARLVIANIDGRNPNVFYELGIAHAIDKGTILVSKSLDEVPVDLKSNRILLYKDHNDFKEQLRTALTRALVRKNA